MSANLSAVLPGLAPGIGFRVRTIHHRGESMRINVIGIFPLIEPDSRVLVTGIHASSNRVDHWRKAGDDRV